MNWETTVKNWETFVKAHEKILALLVVAFLTYHFGEKIVQRWDDRTLKQDTAIRAQLKQQDDSNKLLLAQFQAAQVQYAAELKSLEAKIAQSKQQVVIQQTQDAALPLPELATRWQSMLALPQDSIVSKPDGTLAVTTDAAHTTVNELDKVGPLTEQLLDTQTELKSCQDLNTNAQRTLAGVQGELATEKNARQEDAKVAKINQRKAFWRGFKWGAIAGFVGGIFTGTHL